MKGKDSIPGIQRLSRLSTLETYWKTEMTLNTSTPSPEAVVQSQMPPRQRSGGLCGLAGSAGRAPTIIATNVPLFWGAGRLLFVEHSSHSVLHVLFNLYKNPVKEVLSSPFYSLSSGTTYPRWLPNANEFSVSTTCASHSLLWGQGRITQVRNSRPSL